MPTLQAAGPPQLPSEPLEKEAVQSTPFSKTTKSPPRLLDEQAEPQDNVRTWERQKGNEQKIRGNFDADLRDERVWFFSREEKEG